MHTMLGFRSLVLVHCKGNKVDLEAGFAMAAAQPSASAGPDMVAAAAAEVVASRVDLQASRTRLRELTQIFLESFCHCCTAGLGWTVPETHRTSITTEGGVCLGSDRVAVGSYCSKDSAPWTDAAGGGAVTAPTPSMAARAPRLLRSRPSGNITAAPAPGCSGGGCCPADSTYKYIQTDDY